MSAVYSMHRYRIAGNFCGGLIFAIFMTALTVTKSSTPWKFATVGKGHLVTVATSMHAIVVKHMASASNLLSVCDHPTQYKTSTSLFLSLRWQSLVDDGDAGHGKCDRQEPRKLILEAKSYFSQKFILLKIICYTVAKKLLHQCTMISDEPVVLLELWLTIHTFQAKEKPPLYLLTMESSPGSEKGGGDQQMMSELLIRISS